MESSTLAKSVAKRGNAQVGPETRSVLFSSTIKIILALMIALLCSLLIHMIENSTGHRAWRL